MAGAATLPRTAGTVPCLSPRMAALRRKGPGVLARVLRSARHWALALWAGRAARFGRRRAQAVDLLALARRVHELERQLGRARVQDAGRHLSRAQLEQLCLRTVEEVRGLLAPLDWLGDTLGPAWARERLRAQMRHWSSDAALPAGRLRDASELQAQLLSLGTALTVCARVNGQEGRA